MIIYAVDDEKYSLELLEDTICEAIPGSKPVCFRDPLKLLESAKETVPDIVFLDIQMPDMTGLELAKKLNEISGSIKIIFCTGYSEFTSEAFDVYASGYLLKPCSASDIEKIMEKFSFTENISKDIFIKTFGNFDVFYKGTPINFRSAKAKELLAYLVDRSGSLVVRQEAAGILYEDDYSRGVQSRLSQVATSLSEDLERAGIKDFFFSEKGFHLDMSKAECDMTEFLSGNPKYVYPDEYMEQYSWGEFRKLTFENFTK